MRRWADGQASRQARGRGSAAGGQGTELKDRAGHGRVWQSSAVHTGVAGQYSAVPGNDFEETNPIRTDGKPVTITEIVSCNGFREYGWIL
jgi:hypothetical protein